MPTYNRNYYYLYFHSWLDTGFNFKHFEFSNREEDDREVQCLVSINRFGIHDEYSDECTFSKERYHGHYVSNITAELTNGIASKVNVYGISIYGKELTTSSSAIFRALKYIDDN